jgi:hypothetical protein
LFILAKVSYLHVIKKSFEKCCVYSPVVNV